LKGIDQRQDLGTEENDRRDFRESLSSSSSSSMD